MLDTLRANSRSVLTYVLFGIIIIVFVISFGPGSRGCSSGPGESESWAAMVNGEPVPPSEFESQLERMTAQFGRQMAGDPSGALRTRLREMAMEQVVQFTLVTQAARRMGIVVTDEDVSSTIKTYSDFKTDGRFDPTLYRRVITQRYGSLGRFEDLVRRDLLVQRTARLIQDTVQVTDEDVKNAWAAEADRLEIEFARFPLALAQNDVKASDAQVAEFQAKNGAKIDQFYKDNPARFDRKKRVRARHILVKVEEKAPEAAQAAAKAKLEGLIQRIQKGEDFAKVASEASDDPGSKGQGGDLGFFGTGVMAKPFEEAAFKLKAGELSPPVRTQFGWHVIKVEGVEEPQVVSLEKARPEIARELLETDLSKAAATAAAESVLQKLRAGKTFAEVLPKEGTGAVKMGGQTMTPDKTGPFSARAAPNVPRLGPAPELFKDALQAKSGDLLGKVYEAAGAMVVARVSERLHPDPAKFEGERGQMEARVRRNRSNEIEGAWLKELRASATVQINRGYIKGTVRTTPVDFD